MRGHLNSSTDRSRTTQQNVRPLTGEDIKLAKAAAALATRERRSAAQKRADRGDGDGDGAARMRRRRPRGAPEDLEGEDGFIYDDDATSSEPKETEREKWLASMPALESAMIKFQVARCGGGVFPGSLNDDAFITRRKLSLFRACACCDGCGDDGGETPATMNSGGVSRDGSSRGAVGISRDVIDEYDEEMKTNIVVLFTYSALEITTSMDGRLRCAHCGFTIAYDLVALGLWPTRAPKLSDTTSSGLEHESKYFIDVDLAEDAYWSLTSTTSEHNETAFARELAGKLNRTLERGPHDQIREETLRQQMFKSGSFDAYMLATHPSARLDGDGTPGEGESPVVGGTPEVDGRLIAAPPADEDGDVPGTGTSGQTLVNSPSTILDPAASCPACSIASFGEGAEKPILHVSADGNAKAQRQWGHDNSCDFARARERLNFDAFEFVAPFRLPIGELATSTSYDDLCKPPRDGACNTYVRCAHKYMRDGSVLKTDERSMVVAVCHHGFVMRGTALISTLPERFDMYDQVLATIARTRTIGDVCIDFACKYGVKLGERVRGRMVCEKNPFSPLHEQICRPVDDGSTKPRFMTGWLHGASHSWDCKRQHFGVFKPASCRRAGETTEHIWSRLLPSWPRLRVMASDRRTLILEHTFRRLDARRRKEFPVSFATTCHRLLRHGGEFDKDLTLYVQALKARIVDCGLELGDSELHGVVRRLVVMYRANPDALMDCAISATPRAKFVSDMEKIKAEPNEKKRLQKLMLLASLREQYGLPAGPNGELLWSETSEDYLKGDMELHRCKALARRSELFDALLDVKEIRNQMRDRENRAHTFQELSARHDLMMKELRTRIKAYNAALDLLEEKGKNVDPKYPDIGEITEDHVFEWSEDRGPDGGPDALCFSDAPLHSCEIDLGNGERRKVGLSAHSLRRLMYLMSRVERNVEEIRLLKEERQRVLKHYDEHVRRASTKVEALDERAQVIREALRKSESDGDEKELWSVLRERAEHERALRNNQEWKTLFVNRLDLDGFDELCERNENTYAKLAESGFDFLIAPRSTDCDVRGG